MPTLMLRLAGPMQSWGTTSRFDERDTQLEPSKSGVIGLICAAIGRDRAESVDDLARMRMGVRVDREGVVMRDYQTAMGVLAATGKPRKGETVVSPRFFLSDAAFLVGLQDDGEELLGRLADALRKPKWPLSLGRKAFAPSQPVWLKQGVDGPFGSIHPGMLEEALSSQPLVAPRRREHRGQPVRTHIEHPTDGALRFDQPIGPFAERVFGPRYVVAGVFDHVPEPTAA